MLRMEEAQKKNTELIKAANEALVVDAIRRFKTVKIGEIINLTGLSRQTVLTIIADLQEKKVVEKAGHARSTVGRQPILYSLTKDSYYVIGIDVDVPPVYMAISSLDGTPLYTDSWKLERDVTAGELVFSLISKIEKVLHEMHIAPSKVLGLGLGLPAVVNTRRNLAEKISRIKGWNKIDAAGMIEEHFGFQVYVRNDSHLLSRMEITPERQNFLYILHRSGIGMAPIINGQVYEGLLGNSGYIGHVRIASNGRLCNCGSQDCLELYCSKRAIEDDYCLKTGNFLPYDVILNNAQNSDFAAYDVLRTAGKYFGIGVANAIKMYDISTVILGDLRCTEDNVFFKSIKESALENLKNFYLDTVDIEISSFGTDQYGLGGCLFVLEHFFEEPKLQTSINDDSVTKNGGYWFG